MSSGGLSYGVEYGEEKCCVCGMVIGHLRDVKLGGMGIEFGEKDSEKCCGCKKVFHRHCGGSYHEHMMCNRCCGRLVCGCEYCGLLRARRIEEMHGRCNDVREGKGKWWRRGAKG